MIAATTLLMRCGKSLVDNADVLTEPFNMQMPKAEGDAAAAAGTAARTTPEPTDRRLPERRLSSSRLETSRLNGVAKHPCRCSGMCTASRSGDRFLTYRALQL